jgi:hypothetical protein
LTDKDCVDGRNILGEFMLIGGRTVVWENHDLCPMKTEDKDEEVGREPTEMVSVGNHNLGVKKSVRFSWKWKANKESLVPPWPFLNLPIPEGF